MASGVIDFDARVALFCGERPEWAAALASAQARQDVLLSVPPWAARLAVLGELLGQLALDRAWTHQELDSLLDAIEAAGGLSTGDAAVMLARQITRDPALLSLSPRRAADALLRVLHVVAPVQCASLWVWRPGARLAPVASVGEEEPGRRAREVAREVVVGKEGVANGRAVVRGFPVGAPAGHAGALVVRLLPGRGRRAVLVAQEVAGAFRSVLERQMLAESVIDAEGSAIRFGERGMRRTGIDLHDGPLQQVAQLLGEARLLRSQLPDLLPDSRMRELVAGRVDDLMARVEAINHDLRALARSYAFPESESVDFAEALSDEVALFEARTGTTASLEVSGTLDSLPLATRVAVLRIVAEATGNAHRHGAASHVSVRVVADGAAARVEVSDNGSGFDVESTLARAAGSGHFGVLGMIERARLLGGGVTVESRVGGPTTILVMLPDWSPLGEESMARPAAPARRRAARSAGAHAEAGASPAPAS